MGLGLLKLNTLPLLPRPLPEPPTSSTASDSSTMPSDFDIADYYSSEASLPQEEYVPEAVRHWSWG
jgi:hypothetical protein